MSKIALTATWETGFRSSKFFKKHRLDTRMKQVHLHRANQAKDWTIGQLSKICFIWIWSKVWYAFRRFNERFFSGSWRKSNMSKIIMWSIICSKRTGMMYIVQRIQEKQKYGKVARRQDATSDTKIVPWRWLCLHVRWGALSQSSKRPLSICCQWYPGLVVTCLFVRVQSYKERISGK